MLTIILGIGTIFYDLKSDPTGIQNRGGLLFFLTNNQCFRNITSLELFVAERSSLYMNISVGTTECHLIYLGNYYLIYLP